MSYTLALLSLRPDVRGWSCTDDSSAESLLSTLRNWPGTIVLPTRDELEQVRAGIAEAKDRDKKVRSIRKKCDDALDAGVVHNGVLWHSNVVFLSEVLGLVMGYSLGVFSATQPQTLRGKDGTFVDLDYSTLTKLAAAIGEHRRAVYAAAWAEEAAS
jgi:hypothetical protein